MTEEDNAVWEIKHRYVHVVDNIDIVDDIVNNVS
jgi:hypothetical protein